MRDRSPPSRRGGPLEELQSRGAWMVGLRWLAGSSGGTLRLRLWKVAGSAGGTRIIQGAAQRDPVRSPGVEPRQPPPQPAAVLSRTMARSSRRVPPRDRDGPGLGVPGRRNRATPTSEHARRGRRARAFAIARLTCCEAPAEASSGPRDERSVTMCRRFGELLGCRVARADCSARAPTDPDVRISRIRLVRLRLRFATVDAVHDDDLG